jgi:hypothetical protein
MIKSYCTQNEGNCTTCSLTSYNHDCQNNPIHGGNRPGAGRPATGAKPNRTFRLDDEEYAKVKAFIKSIRT